jgi:hypothetical protein
MGCSRACDGSEGQVEASPGTYGPCAGAGSGRAVLWFLNRDLAARCLCRTCCWSRGCLDWGDGGRAAAGHRIGWLFLGVGLVAALTGFGFQYAVRAGITDPGSPPAGWLLAAVAGWT